MKNQTIVREFCFQYLFHLQLPIFEEEVQSLQEHQGENKLRAALNDFKNTTNHLLDDHANELAFTRVSGVLNHYKEIQDKVSDNLNNWKLSRLSKVDLTNLMLATHELMFETETPQKVVINEAIEVSKKFGTTDSASFINGVLDSIAKSISS